MYILKVVVIAVYSFNSRFFRLRESLAFYISLQFCEGKIVMAAIILTHAVLCSVAASHSSSACLESTAASDAAKNTAVCKSGCALSILLL